MDRPKFRVKHKEWYHEARMKSTRDRIERTTKKEIRRKIRQDTERESLEEGKDLLRHAK